MVSSIPRGVHRMAIALNQRSLYAKIMEQTTDDGQLLVDGNFGTKGHGLKEMITTHFFICIAKNLTKEITTAVSLSKNDKSVEKSAKL